MVLMQMSTDVLRLKHRSGRPAARFSKTCSIDGYDHMAGSVWGSFRYRNQCCRRLRPVSVLPVCVPPAGAPSDGLRGGDLEGDGGSTCRRKRSSPNASYGRAGQRQSCCHPPAPTGSRADSDNWAMCDGSAVERRHSLRPVDLASGCGVAGALTVRCRHDHRTAEGNAGILLGEVMDLRQRLAYREEELAAVRRLNADLTRRAEHSVRKWLHDRPTLDRADCPTPHQLLRRRSGLPGTGGSAAATTSQVAVGPGPSGSVDSAPSLRFEVRGREGHRPGHRPSSVISWTRLI